MWWYTGCCVDVLSCAAMPGTENLYATDKLSQHLLTPDYITLLSSYGSDPPNSHNYDII
jgi:hypothetical protein